jgi:hypothetical protein
LLGEVVRCITGQTLTAFVAEAVAGPLGSDYDIGARRDATTAHRS